MFLCLKNTPSKEICFLCSYVLKTHPQRKYVLLFFCLYNTPSKEIYSFVLLSLKLQGSKTAGGGYLAFAMIDFIDINISSASFLFRPAFSATANKSSSVGSMLSLIEVV